MNPFPLARILNLLFFLIALICCFPVVLVLLLLLWFTGRLGLARSFVSGRTVFADFSRHHTASPPPRQSPEELIGKTIVVVANLKPAKIRGVESYGMLLAAKDGENLRLVTIDAPDFPGGASVG